MLLAAEILLNFVQLVPRLMRDRITAAVDSLFSGFPAQNCCTLFNRIIFLNFFKFFSCR
jgi:hypothetical protein